MRTVLHPQLTLTEVDIGAIQFDMRSRDDIPKLLLGLQRIYTQPHVRAAVFEILKEIVPQESAGDGKASLHRGRPGMTQWRILVLGTLRLALNADYDRLMELANYHVIVRQMLGHPGAIDALDPTSYTLQTLKDNLKLFTPELLARINEVVVRAGHELIKKTPPRAPPRRLTRAWTPLWWKRMCTTRPMPICCSMRSASSSRSAPASAPRARRAGGASLSTTSAPLSVSAAR